MMASYTKKQRERSEKWSGRSILCNHVITQKRGKLKSLWQADHFGMSSSSHFLRVCVRARACVNQCGFICRAIKTLQTFLWATGAQRTLRGWGPGFKTTHRQSCYCAGEESCAWSRLNTAALAHVHIHGTIPSTLHSSWSIQTISLLVISQLVQFLFKPNKAVMRYTHCPFY